MPPLPGLSLIHISGDDQGVRPLPPQQLQQAVHGKNLVFQQREFPQHLSQVPVGSVDKLHARAPLSGKDQLHQHHVEGGAPQDAEDVYKRQGYSSLSLLGGFPLDTIKLDRTFMDRALSSSRSQTIVQKVVEMAHEMGILVICEGVELPEQARFLLQIGCQHAQGYLYARPIPADAFEALCRQNTPVAPAADR